MVTFVLIRKPLPGVSTLKMGKVNSEKRLNRLILRETSETLTAGLIFGAFAHF